MQIFKSLSSLPFFRSGTAVAIGNFDGLHLGHRHILQALAEAARRNRLPSFVLTFSPHPEKVLGEGRVCMIQTLEQRLKGIEACGIRFVLVTPFNRSFSKMTDDDFIQKILLGAFRAKEVIVGNNFRFGKGRRGDVGLLRLAGRQFGFCVRAVPPVVSGHQVVSSSLIRYLLQEGKVGEAHRLLGGPFTIIGRVVEGRARGKTLGFPTANIQPENEITPPGVFITKTIVGHRSYISLTNIGHRPTFRHNKPARKKAVVECHIIGLNRDIYGKKIEISFLKKLREEKKFESAEILARQIEKDLELTKSYFSRHGIM